MDFNPQTAREALKDLSKTPVSPRSFRGSHGLQRGPRPPEHILTGPQATPPLHSPPPNSASADGPPALLCILLETSVLPQALLRRERWPRRPPPPGLKPAEGRDRVQHRPGPDPQPRVKYLPGHGDLKSLHPSGMATPSLSRKAEEVLRRSWQVAAFPASPGASPRPLAPPPWLTSQAQGWHHALLERRRLSPLLVALGTLSPQDRKSLSALHQSPSSAHFASSGPPSRPPTACGQLAQPPRQPLRLQSLPGPHPLPLTEALQRKDGVGSATFGTSGVAAGTR